MVLDLERNEFKDTYTIGDGEALRVNQVCSDGTWLYAATESGLRRLLADPFLVDYNAWERVSGIPFPDGAYSGVAWYANTLFAAYRDPAGV
ncbi:MAG: hypothetical protein R2751_09365 [Bacteroidales bacterium]